MTATMRTGLRTAAAAALLWVGVAWAGGAEPLAVGERAPGFSVVDPYGKPFHLAAHIGRGPLVLVFYRGYF